METTPIISQQSDFIARIYERYFADLKFYFLAYTHDEMQAEDMVHNLFLKLMGVDMLVEATIQCLLFTTAHRMIIDDIRHQYYVQKAETKTRNGMELSCPEDVYDKMERDQLLALEEQKLRTMPKKRACVYRMWREEKSMKEIALALNISRRTVEAHVYNATCEMKQFLRKAI